MFSVVRFCILLICASGAAAASGAEVEPCAAFSFAFDIDLLGPPEVVYDAVTGDISGWWDHSFSENPRRLEIEARPGGGFWEIFDDHGDGVRHAVVTCAERGARLRFEGPLGLAGHALHMVTTYEFAPLGADSTRLRLDVHGAGELDPTWPEIIEKTWRHFMFEQLQPYLAAGGRRGAP